MSTVTIPNITLENRSDLSVDLASHPLSEKLPEPYYLKDYVSRSVEGVADLDLLAAAHRLHKNVLLAGPTGSAKTSLVYAYGVRSGLPVINVACNGGADIRQLIGGWSPKPDGGYHFAPGELVLGAMHGAVILLNEINMLPPKIAAVVFGLLDRRRTIYLPDAAGSEFPTQVKAHPATCILADYNPGYIGTRPLNEALRNRFAIKLTWGYEPTVEAELVTSTSLLEMATKLRERSMVGDINTPISTNALMEFEELAWDDGLGFEFAVYNFLNSFDPDERKVVSEVIEMYLVRIREELLGKPEVVQALEEFHGTFGSNTTSPTV